ncbi:MAG: ERCC4 domain-containing protein [Candidatus Aenigmarchaeota archaeon]|nr:ERCC4 domain-containing protein [Candidatus Aenigmarchaeota archaeon]
MIQRILKPKDKPVIITDIRENKCSVKSYLEDLGAVVKVIPLKVGDYICSERVCLEKKTANDFISSIVDGRLFQQAEELKDNFSKPIILVEGNYYPGGMNENAIKAALATIILNYEIPIIMTRDEEETARTIFWLAKREQMVSKRGIGIKGEKKPKKLKDLQEHFISGLPGISVVLSKRILEKFKTIRNFANAEESELSKVKGIGKTLAKRLHKLLNEEYGGNA